MISARSRSCSALTINVEHNFIHNLDHHDVVPETGVNQRARPGSTCTRASFHARRRRSVIDMGDDRRFARAMTLRQKSADVRTSSNRELCGKLRARHQSYCPWQVRPCRVAICCHGRRAKQFHKSAINIRCRLTFASRRCHIQCRLPGLICAVERAHRVFNDASTSTFIKSRSTSNCSSICCSADIGNTD